MWQIIEQGHRRTRLATVRTPRGVWVGYPGGAAWFDLQARARPSSGDSDAAIDREIRAPMTGRVVQVGVAIGDKVDEGATLVVLEAMKMEYRLRAPKSGEIAALSCRVGDLVDLGAVLVTLAP